MLRATMTSSQLGRPVGADGEKTRQRIIAATMRCVARDGYAATTIRQIAAAADMTSAALYNYFPTKADLIHAAISARADIALPRLRRAAQRPGTVADRLEAVLDESGQLMREFPDLAAFEWAIRADNALAALDVHGGDSGVEFEAMRRIIRDIVDDEAAVDAIYALVYGLTELAATASAPAYQRALTSAKQLVRGTLFSHQKPANPSI
jgi:AcrR family transcriptional regulator